MNIGLDIDDAMTNTSELEKHIDRLYGNYLKELSL